MSLSFSKHVNCFDTVGFAMSDEIMLFFTLVPCFSEAIELPHLVITAFAVREYSTNRFYRIVDHKISNRFDATNLVIDNHRLR